MRRLILGLLVIAVLAWLVWRWAAMPTREPTLGAVTDTVGVGFKAVHLFFAAPSGDSLVSEAREMAEVQGLHERVSALVQALGRGPAGRGVAALPAGTTVLHVYLDDRGRMTLDLSRAFQQGFRGGANAEYLAVASLLRTIGANLPEVRSVLLVCGGSPLTTLGGHVPLDQPIDVSALP
jgi:Sporulation and spore germination